MFFHQRLMKTRKLELGPLRKAILFKFFSKFLNLSSTMVVTLCTLTIYVILEFSVSVKAVFIGFYLIYLLKTPFSSILFIFTSLIQGTVSISRVEKFLGEKNVQTLFSQKSAEPTISIKNASFTWESNKTPCVKKLSLQAADSCLIAVVGGPQSGKTSFLQALFGQLQKLEGYACVKGNFSYVSDPPWIQNATVENNILFLKAKDEVNYKETLKACDLLGDIEILPDGDQTEIGEKGYLLNDDQKVKVDLARAVYKDADIYLLDEPLRKAKHPEHLFQRVIGHNGMLKNKIRVFTSSNASFVPLADLVLYLENGFVVEQGRYSELIEKNGLFSKYVNELPDSNDKILTKHSTKVLDDALDTKDETVRGYCDPWYSTSPLSLKPSLESRLFSDVALEPKGLFGYLLKYAKINGFFLTVVSVVLAIAACCFEVVSWIWWTKWTPESILKDDVYKHLYEYVGLITAQVICNALCGLVVFMSSTLAVARLYKWLLNRVLKAYHTAFGPNFIEKVFQSFNHDLRDADESLPLVYYVWLMIVFKAPVLLFIIYFKAPLLILLHSPLFFAYFVIQKLYLNSWRQLHHLTSSTRFPLSNLLNEALHGMPSIRAYGASFNYLERFQGKLDIHNNCYFTFLLASRWLSCCLDIIGSIFVLTTSLTLLIEKSLDDNFIGLIIVFSMQISEHLLALIYVSSLLETNFPTLERLTSFSCIKQESEWENPSNKLPSSWPTSGLISIENLCAAYGDAVYPALNSINLLIQPKQKVVIRSEDKDGIYALLDSLFRMREISPNEIFIDSIDIREIGLQDLRCRLGFVPQEPLVFDGTFRENMDPMNQFSDAEVWEASKTAELDWCFSHLDEPVRKDLSLEVKKRMSYARCFLKKSKVVVLEEPEGLTSEAKALFSSSTLLAFSTSKDQEGFDRYFLISSDGKLTELSDKGEETDL